MNQHDFFRLLTKGLKFSGNHNKEVLKKFGYINGKNERQLLDQIETPVIHQDLSTEESEKVPEKKPKKNKLRSAEKQALLKKEEINHIRNVNKIHVYGTDIPSPIQKFDDLAEQYNVNKKIVENLLNEGYDSPTPIQMQSWSLMLKRRELLASAPTGSGKTAGFLVPVIHHLKQHRSHGFRAVILAPTRELAKQILRESDRLAAGTNIKSSNIDKVKAEKCLPFIKKFDILITTPNRLLFLLGENEEITKVLSKVEWLIVDESDRLYEAGKNGFRDQLATIYKACSGPNVVRAMFSATFDYHVEQWCKLNLNNPVTVSVGVRNASCLDVEQELVYCGSDRGKLIALREILKKGYEPPALVFVQTKERAKELYKELLLDDLRVAYISADQTQPQRDSVVQSFRERKIWILICTELMGRGIDFIGINLVINYDFPSSVVNYIHRVGRTGRAGRRGMAKTFWTFDDKPLLRSIAQIIKNSGSPVGDFLLNLKRENEKERKSFAKNVPDRGFISERAKREKLLSERRKLFKQKRKPKQKSAESKTEAKEDSKSQKRKREVTKKKETVKNADDGSSQTLKKKKKKIKTK